MCFYGDAPQIALVALSKEKTCHIFTEASLAQQLGDQATVYACKDEPDKRDRHLSAILNGLRATYTDACGLAWGKTNIHVHTYTHTHSQAEN